METPKEKDFPRKRQCKIVRLNENMINMKVELGERVVIDLCEQDGEEVDSPVDMSVVDNEDHLVKDDIDLAMDEEQVEPEHKKESKVRSF